MICIEIFDERIYEPGLKIEVICMFYKTHALKVKNLTKQIFYVLPSARSSLQSKALGSMRPAVQVIKHITEL